MTPTQTMSPTAARVRDYLADTGPTTVRRAAADLRLPFPTVLGALVSLCDLGLACTEARREFGWNTGDTRSDPRWRLT